MMRYTIRLVAAIALCATALSGKSMVREPATALLAGVRVGSPMRYENLTVFPLFVAGPAGRQYLPLDEAIQSGQVRVEEKGKGEVNTVRVRNAGKSYVFGIAGEIVSGAKQDRMLQDDLLLPPGSGWLDVPVYCTEHGRWAGASLEFGAKGQVVAGRVRERAAKSPSQADVWDEVEQSRSALNVRSATGAFAGVYEEPAVQRRVDEYARRFDQLPEAASGAAGVLVAVGSRIVCVDLFGSPALFRRMWPKLLRSYVIDAVSQSADGSMTERRAREFLRAAALSSASSIPSVGAGSLKRLRSAVATGSTLLFGREVVHLDLFPSAGTACPDDGGDAPRLQIRREQSRQ
jgi:hypothetical protein